MTAILIIAATVILLALIFWRGRSPDFKRESEYPKFRFLENLGISGPPPVERRDISSEQPSSAVSTPWEGTKND